MNNYEKSGFFCIGIIFIPEAKTDDQQAALSDFHNLIKTTKAKQQVSSMLCR